MAPIRWTPALLLLMFPLVILIFAAAVILMVVLVILNIRQAKKRREMLAIWAAQRGLSFDAKIDRTFKERYPDLRGLHRGEDSQYADNIMLGSLGGRYLQCFDYHYFTTSRDNKGHTTTHHHRFSAILLTGETNFRPLLIRPEGVFDRITAFFGFDDIDFELDAFNRAFYVKGPDRRWAFDVMHQETMEFLLDSPRFHIEMSGPDMLVYRGSTFDTGGFDDAIAVGVGILDRLPKDLQVTSGADA